MKVCHIVNWYPNEANNKEAIWTKKHIDALNRKCENDVFHVQVNYGRFKYKSTVISNSEQSYILCFPTSIWFLKEILTTILLCYVLIFKMKRRNYDIFNFQITYPLLTYSKLIGWVVKKPIVVTEHWSAYHLNFGVIKELKRIKKIFSNKKLKFICVSEALVRDIEVFSGRKINSKIVPNIIYDSFHYMDKERKENSFFMLSFWKYPKNPFLIFDVFKSLQEQGINFSIGIGGFGPLLDKMKLYTKELGLSEKVDFFGKLDTEEIVEKFNENNFFIHNSDYEVSSVVCMESICCGTPVVASEVGGIVEYVNDQNGLLVKDNDVKNWEVSIKKALQENFDRQEISGSARSKFSEEVVASIYYKALVEFKEEIV